MKAAATSPESLRVQENNQISRYQVIARYSLSKAGMNQIGCAGDVGWRHCFYYNTFELCMSAYKLKSQVEILFEDARLHGPRT